MSYPARDPRSGIDGQAIAIVAEAATSGFSVFSDEGDGMSYPARDPRSGIDGQANAMVTDTYACITCTHRAEVTA